MEAMDKVTYGANLDALVRLKGAEAVNCDHMKRRKPKKALKD